MMPVDGNEQPDKARSTLLIVGERLFNALLERFSAPQSVKRNRIILFFLTVTLLTLLLTPGQQFSRPVYKVGEIAASDIRATQDYLLEDRQLTEKKRLDAESLAPYVYDLNVAAPHEITQRFDKAFSSIAAARTGEKGTDRAGLRNLINQTLGIQLSDPEFSSMMRFRADRVLVGEINRLTGLIFANKVVSDKRLFTSDLAHGIQMQDSRTCELLATLDRSFTAIDLSEAQKRVFEIHLNLPAEPHDVLLIKKIIAKSLLPNLTLNREATEERRRAAREAVAPILFQLKRGEMIVRSGERFTEDQVRRLGQIYAGRSVVARLAITAGTFCLVMILCYFPYRFARKNVRKFSPGNKDLMLLALVTLFHFTLLRIGLMFSTAMGGALPSVGAANFYYLLPFAFAPMLVRIILNSEVALVYCAVCAPLAGAMFDGSMQVVIFALMGGVVGAHGVRQCKDRGVIYSAGLKVSVVNVAMALSFQILGDGFFSLQTVYCAFYALIGGVVNATLVTGIIPAVESMFQYSTDMKLLEYSNLNSPLLHNLMVRAPGTYHHSVLVGNLVEAAAEAIHANPLLAKVAAYYHDIGKVSKPLYFIENVRGGDNKHDKLSPSMSALILIAHVKEGVELAREYRLGSVIIDIIRQSHGTSLISFFYQKAKTQSSEPSAINDQDFRYPGPKPQTREAGLVLLADAVEAASRTLSDPTSARIQGLVQKIINNIFIDGQLDECELTLKNLHEIAKSFNRVLNGIYHHRIDYPEPAFKEKSSGGRKLLENSDSEPPAASPDVDTADKKSSSEGLKRLGSSR
jgi:putative nucleotidyltransferase with HDIG domain